MRTLLVHAMLSLSLLCRPWTAYAQDDSLVMTAEEHKAIVTAMFLDGERLRRSGHYDMALSKCLNAWELRDGNGLICASRVEFARANYTQARAYLALLSAHLDTWEPANYRLRFLMESERERLDNRDREVKWERKNSPELTSIGGFTRRGNKVHATVRWRNRSQEPLVYSRMQHDGTPGAATLKWRGEQRRLKSGQEIVGDITFLLADWAKGSITFTLYGMIGNTPVESKWTPVKVTWADPPDPRWKHLTLAVRGSFGGFWVPDRREAGQGFPEPTTTKGLAIRIGKGFSQYLAVEGEFAGGSTGHAEFEPGVTVSGRYGRAVVQGVARYGKEWVSSLRLGTGLQVAVYESSNASATGTDIEGVYALGVGLERRLRDLSIGAHFQYLEGLKSGASILGIGLQVSYGWTL